VQERWDAVVVGAGLGGLTAAARLVGEGLRVLLVEQDPHPGGTAYTFIRRGFQFPMGPLGFSSPGLVRETWEELTGKVLELRRVDYLVRTCGLEAVISLPWPRLESELVSVFPSEAAGIHDFLDLVRRNDRPGPASAVHAGVSLDGLVRDERLRRILGSQGTRESYSSLALLASMWRLMCEEGIHYPVGGFRFFCDGLADTVHCAGRQGGEIRLQTEVAEIVADAGQATGLILGDGSEIEAGAIICNADFKTTFLSLLAPRQVPPEWSEAVRDARQTSSNLQVALGVDAERVDLSAFARAGRIIYRRSEGNACLAEIELDWDAEELDPAALAGRELELCLWSADDAALAPPGGAVVVIRTSAAYRHFARLRPARGARTPGYAAYKERLGSALTAEAATVLPGLAEAIEVMDVATPLTFEDRGRRSGGAVAGWSWEFGNDREGVERELVRTPLAGLYMAGYQAFSSLRLGGIPTAMESGRLAAAAVLDGAPPVSEVTIPRPATP
jgi:all-trans-retinol 13,14-reductase